MVESTFDNRHNQFAIGVLMESHILLSYVVQITPGCRSPILIHMFMWCLPNTPLIRLFRYSSCSHWAGGRLPWALFHFVSEFWYVICVPKLNLATASAQEMTCLYPVMRLGQRFWCRDSEISGMIWFRSEDVVCASCFPFSLVVVPRRYVHRKMSSNGKTEASGARK